MQFPIGLFGVAIGTASVPILSRMASGEGIKKIHVSVKEDGNFGYVID